MSQPRPSITDMIKYFKESEINPEGTMTHTEWTKMVRYFQRERLLNELPAEPTWTHNDDKRVELSVAHLYEEIGEINDAVEQRDLAGVVDGLVDLMYYGIGMALQLGVDLSPHFVEVHMANMAKVHNPEALPGKEKRVTKPVDWVEPRTLLMLLAQGYKGH